MSRNLYLNSLKIIPVPIEHEHNFDYSAQKEYINKLMIARGCSENYDMFCIIDNCVAENNPIIDAYNKAVQFKKEYFVVCVSTYEKNIVCNVKEAIKPLVKDESLEMVLCFDGTYNCEVNGAPEFKSEILPSWGDIYFIFSLRKIAKSVRFVDIFTPAEEIKAVYEKSRYEDRYDQTSGYHLGFGRAIDVDYSEIFDNELILNGYFYYLLLDEAQKVKTNDRFIRIRDLIYINKYNTPYIPDVKKWDNVENFSDNVGRVLTHVPSDMMDADKDPNSIDIGLLLPLDSIAIKYIRSKCSFLYNSAGVPVYVVGATNHTQKVVTYNKDIVNGAYITQLLMICFNNPNLEALSVYLHSLLEEDCPLSLSEAECLKIAIPESFEEQGKVVSCIIEEYKKEVVQAQAVERARLGIHDTSANCDEKFHHCLKIIIDNNALKDSDNNQVLAMCFAISDVCGKKYDYTITLPEYAKLTNKDVKKWYENKRSAINKKINDEKIVGKNIDEFPKERKYARIKKYYQDFLELIKDK